MSGMHKVGNTLLNLAFRLLFRYPIRDSQSGMWGFRRVILPRLHVISDGMPFSEELKIEVLEGGYRYLEIPIDYRARTGEKKIRSFKDAFKNFLWLFRKRFRWIPTSA